MYVGYVELRRITLALLIQAQFRRHNKRLPLPKVTPVTTNLRTHYTEQPRNS